MNDSVVVKVKPGSRKGPLVEVGPDGELTIYVRERAVDGKANDAVTRLLAAPPSIAKKPSRIGIRNDVEAQALPREPLSSASHASADSPLTARTDRHSGSRYGVFMRRVDYVIHYVESLRRSVTFYRDVIGLQVRIEGDGYVEFEMDNTKFSLFDRSKLPGLIGREGGNPPCGEIGFLIEDVDGEAERLRGLGVEILSGPVDRPWHERTLHIADPDGNIIEFAQKLR